MTAGPATAEVDTYLEAVARDLRVRRSRRSRILSEIEAHLLDHAAALQANGVEAGAAHAAAVAAFGPATAVTEPLSQLDRLRAVRRRTLVLSVLLVVLSVATTWSVLRAAADAIPARGTPEMLVVFDAQVTSDQMRALAAEVEQAGAAAVIEDARTSAPHTYRNAGEILSADPDLRHDVASAYLPGSLLVDLDDPAQFETVAEQLRDDTGVRQIVDHRARRSLLLDTTQGALAAAMVLTAVYLLATLLVAARTRKASLYGA